MKPLLTRNRSLFLAIALVLAAVLLALALIRQSSSTETYLVASRDLGTGTAVQATDFRQTQAALGAQSGLYLSKPPVGAILASPVLANQLVPKAAIANLTQPNFKPLLITPSQSLSKNIRVGSRVQVWFVPKQTSQTGLAVQLLKQSEVLAIHKPEDSLGKSISDIEVAVPQESLAAVITAIASAGFISVISES